MPAIVIYTDPLANGNGQMPVYVVGDDQNWSLRFSDGTNVYNPGNVTLKIGYVAGLPDGTYANAFQWVDRLANQHIGSFSITAGVPSTLTWDENPIGVNGVDGAFLILGRTPPSSQIRKVNVVYGGTGLSTAPQIRFQGGASETGQQATGTATVSAGDVSAIAVTNAGRGYSGANPPEVIITGDGTGAVWKVDDTNAAAVIAAGHIRGFVKVKVGSGYTTATVTIVDPEASATTAVGGTSAVISIVLLAGGMGYTSSPTVAITGGGGASATATASLLNSTWGVSAITVTGAGADFTSTPAVTFTGGTGSGAAAVATVVPKGQITAIAITSGGTYTNAGDPGDGYQSLTISGGGGTAAAAHALMTRISPGVYTFTGPVIIDNGGSGYTSAPTATYAPAGGFSQTSAATFTASVSTGTVTSVTVTNPGSGYGATAPTIGFTGGGGTGATATASLIGSPVGSLTLTNGGSGYTSPPLAGFSGGNGSGATAITTVSLGITAVTMTKPGFAYTSQPSITIAGTITNGAILEAAGIETYSVPYLRNFAPLSIGSGVSAVPWTHNRRNSSGDLVYDDSLLLIQPQNLLTPTLTLQADGLTWAGIFNPVVRYVAAVLNFRRSVTVDFTLTGGGRTLFSGPLTIQRAQN